jgi:hypothetical protein
MSGLLDLLMQHSPAGLLGNSSDNAAFGGLLGNAFQNAPNNYMSRTAPTQNAPFSWGIGDINGNPSGMPEDIIAQREALLNRMYFDAQRQANEHRETIARYNMNANDPSLPPNNRMDWESLRNMRQQTLIKTLMQMAGPGKGI